MMAVVLALGVLSDFDVITKSAKAESNVINVNWNLSTWGKRRPFTEGIEAVSKYVSNKSEGHFTIKINYSGILSIPRKNLFGISR